MPRVGVSPGVAVNGGDRLEKGIDARPGIPAFVFREWEASEGLRKSL